MDEYKAICENKKCFLCGACRYMCRVHAIDYKYRNGFPYPYKNQSCNDCKRCSTVCPAISLKGEFFHPIALYAAAIHDNKVYEKSASGGIATAIARSIISNGGVVVGAEMQFDNVVRHTVLYSIDDLYRIQNTKYVQSNIISTFDEIESLLKAQRTVLFIGTPCQVASVKNVFHKYKTLVTIDLFCKGVPPEKLYLAYVDYLKKKYKTDTLMYSFRNKNIGYGVYPQITDGKGKVHNLIGLDSAYNKAMGLGYLKESCYDCQFSRIDRIGDISIGDYHGKIHHSKNMSCVFINSERAKTIFEQIKEKCHVFEIDENDAMYGQSACFSGGVKVPKKYNEFCSCMESTDNYSTIARKYLMPDSLFKRLFLEIVPAKAQSKFFVIKTKISDLLRR